MARDYAFEALAEVTNTDWNAGRGELNAGLKSIKEQSEITDSYLLADEIHKRAKLYRKVMPEVMLTPTALAKHWARVYEEMESRRFVDTTNVAAKATACDTCGGDRFVLYSTRKPVTTAWMEEHGIKASETDMLEEYAPCPDCNSTADTSFHRPDGSQFRSPDPGKVREMLEL